MEVQAVVEHEPPDKRVKWKTRSVEEMGEKNYPLMGPWGGQKLPRRGKPVRDVLGQISGVPKLFDLTLRNGGSHPLATRSGHRWSRLGKKERTWALELECAEDGWAKDEEGVGERGGSLSPYIG